MKLMGELLRKDMKLPGVVSQPPRDLDATNRPPDGLVRKGIPNWSEGTAWSLAKCASRFLVGGYVEISLFGRPTVWTGPAKGV